MASSRGLVTLIFVVSTVITGCHLIDSRQPAVQRWGGFVSDLRVQWASNAGIDLLTGVAVPVRAYLESRLLAQYAGNLDYAYAGFTRAVPQNESPDSSDVGARERRPSLERPVDASRIGNSSFHIQSVERSGRNVTVTVCNYVYSVAEEQPNGNFVTLVDFGPVETRGIVGMRVLLVAPDDETTTVLAPQTGPAPAPDSDVFGNWRITGFLTATGSSVKAQWNYEADYATCVDEAPDPPERRAFLTIGEHPRSDFPTSPPSPGWPEGTS